MSQLIFDLVYFILRVYAHIYLIKMFFIMQELLRQHGHIKHKKGEVCVVVCYLSFFCNMFINQIILPLVLVGVNFDDNYRCNEAMKRFISVCYGLANEVWPLSFQLMFFGLVWQMSRV